MGFLYWQMYRISVMETVWNDLFDYGQKGIIDKRRLKGGIGLKWYKI